MKTGQRQTSRAWAPAIILLVLVLPATGLAELSLDWWTVDGGGAMKQNSGSLGLSGSVGQPDAGPRQSAGTLSLRGGFWKNWMAVSGIRGQDLPGEIPAAFRMYPAFPNPFNPQTTLAFDIPQTAMTRLDIYDLRGLRVRRMVNERLVAGRYTRVWDGRNDFGRVVDSGVYLVLVVSGQHRSVKKIVLIK